VRVYLDSCVVIYLIQGPEDLSQTVRSKLRACEKISWGSFAIRLLEFSPKIPYPSS
jgi:hypothetical protein